MTSLICLFKRVRAFNELVLKNGVINDQKSVLLKKNALSSMSNLSTTVVIMDVVLVVVTITVVAAANVIECFLLVLQKRSELHDIIRMYICPSTLQRS
jgi:hypothetical protein